MAKKNQRIYTILGAALGTGLAVYGIRQGIRWYQQRRRYDMQLSDDAWQGTLHYQTISEPDRELIPSTGPMAAAPPMTGTTTAERVNSDMVSDFDDRGTAFTTTEMNAVQVEDATVDNRPMTGSEVYGRVGDSWAETSSAPQVPTSNRSELVLDEFVAPLIEHAIAFNSVMNLLRSRQREGQGYEGTESLTEGDRNSMRAVLQQMQERVTDFDEADLRKNKLAQRSFDLTHRLRDALDNLTYTGADLFRIHSELRSELCSLTSELEKSGQVTITGLDQIRQLYEC